MRNKKNLENQVNTVEEEEPERKLNHTKHKVSKVIQKRKHKFSNDIKPITISNLQSKFNAHTNNNIKFKIKI